MSFNFLLKKLLILTGILAFIISGLRYIPGIPIEYTRYSWYNLLFFGFLSLLLLYLGYLGVKNKSTQTFMAAIFGSFFLKLLFSIGFFLVLHFTEMIDGKLFLIPFGIFYVIYTIFETIQMYQLNKLVYLNAPHKPGKK